MSIRAVAPVLLACALGSCAPLVQQPGGHTRQAELENDSAVMDDGTALPLHRWLPENGAPHAVVLAVHGLNDYGAAFQSVGERLAAEGIAVYAFDQRGFGATEQRGIWAGEGALADDVWRIATLLRERHPGVPLYALGESMGGAVVLLALRRHGDDWVDAAALMAPAVWRREYMHWYQRWPLRVLSHSWRGLELSGRITGKRPTDDPATLAYLRNDPMVLRKARVDVLYGIANLMDTVTMSTKIEVPTLILYGGNDEIVPERPMCSWVASLDGDEPWQFAVYPEGWHLLSRDSHAATLLEDLSAWFADPGSRLPSEADASGHAFCAKDGV